MTVTEIAKAKRAWQRGLLVTKQGAPSKSLANVMHVLSLHPDWDGVLAYDEFGLAVVSRREPPMRSQDAPANYEAGDWTDEDSARTVAWFASEIGFEPTVSQVDQAVATVAKKTVVHPVRDWLSSLTWDDVPRLSDFAAVYLGAPTSAYAAAVGRRWMIAAVARVFDPGCKVDSLLGLEGAQGIGKSSALRLLAGAEWFADTGILIGDKDSYQSLRRKWIYEFAELASIRGRDIERVKNFLSSQTDTFRASYGRRTQDYPRQVVFAGSTNEEHYLADPTGSRRFWPIRCRRIDLPALKRDREMLWAEARVAYEAGEPWHLDTAELRALAAAEAAEREEGDDWVEIVARWLEHPTRPDGHGGREIISIDAGLTTGDILLGALGFAAERLSAGATKRAGHVLRALGFQRRQVRIAGKWNAREHRYFSSTGDVTGDNDTAESGSCLTSPNVTHDLYTCENKYAESLVGKSSVTSVTRDVDSDDIEREAIQMEWK